jgi:hypothetical protein
MALTWDASSWLPVLTLTNAAARLMGVDPFGRLALPLAHYPGSYDPIVLAHARRLLSNTPDGGATAYIHADLRQPDTILGHPSLSATLDLTKPVALLLISVVPFLTDADDPYDKVARLARALAPGSHLAMSHGTIDFLPADAAAEYQAMIRRESARSRERIQIRDRAQFARFFDGMELVPPGIVALPDWRSELPPGDRPTAAEVSFYGAVARIR